MTSDKIADGQLDELLRQSYETLRKSDPAQRQVVLDKCDSRRAEVGGNALRPVVSGSDGAVPLPFGGRRWRASRLVSFSAVAGIAVMAVALFRWTPSAGMAYGIDGLPDRLQQVQSISLRGWQWMHNQSRGNSLPIRAPFELQVKRPGMFRNSVTSSSTKNGKTEFRNQVHLCDGKQEWLADEGGKPLFVLQSLSAFDARLKTEYLAQIGVLTAVLGPAGSQYQKVGVDSADGRRCDVYQARFAIGRHATVSKVWMDPRTGFPVRVVREELDSTGKLTDELELTEIQVNVPLADDLFRPAGSIDGTKPNAADSQAAQSPLVLEVSAIESASSGEGKLEAWYALQISSKAALVVWRRSPPRGPAPTDPLADLSINLTDPHGERPVRHTWVDRAKRADDWSWSLVASADGKPIDQSLIGMVMETKHSRLTLSFPGLRFDDRELEQIVVAAEHATLGRSAEEVTLRDLRELAGKLPAGGSR
jgi:outer membrane lipoprotein-sorting protein